MLVKSIGLPIQVITGYNGNEDQLAMRRGEVQGIVGSRSTFQQFVDDGNGKFIAQIGGSESDVPQLASMVTSEEGKKAIALVESQSDISRLTAGPAGIPADRLKVLRDAYAAATSDPEFIAKAKTLGLPIDPLIGDAVGDSVKTAMDQTPEIVQFLKDSLKPE
jgi:tripartite-type tricarboxylate transporter receptor subunit TctC